MQEGDSEMKSVSSVVMEELFWYYILLTWPVVLTALYIMQFNRELVSRQIKWLEMECGQSHVQ